MSLQTKYLKNINIIKKKKKILTNFFNNYILKKSLKSDKENQMRI